MKPNIVDKLKLVKEINNDFVKKIDEISLEDIILLKLYVSYWGLNRKFLYGLPVFKLVDKIVKDAFDKFLEEYSFSDTEKTIMRGD